MLREISLKNVGPLSDVSWSGLGNLNLVIGNNGCGKTFLLKAIYSAIKSIEIYKRGKEPRELGQILAEKLHWTFQAEKIGDLVSKKSGSPLSCTIQNEKEKLQFSFGRDTTKNVSLDVNTFAPRNKDSIFLPAKEVLSLFEIIKKNRNKDLLFGFDDTYVDLVNALTPSTKGKNYETFAQARKNLEGIFQGKIEFDSASQSWYFKQGRNIFVIGVTAEGIKKIGILDTLLGNRYLTPGSIVFIDEPESALHPNALCKFLEIISMLSEEGIQFFLASHSYFVIKKLYLLAREKKSISVLAAEDNKWKCFDLRDGLPQNAIVDESIQLYLEEVGG